MKLLFKPRARDDVISIRDSIDRRSPRGARNVKAALLRTIEVIGSIPKEAGLPANSRSECCRRGASHIDPLVR